LVLLLYFSFICLEGVCKWRRRLLGPSQASISTQGRDETSARFARLLGTSMRFVG